MGRECCAFPRASWKRAAASQKLRRTGGGAPARTSRLLQSTVLDPRPADAARAAPFPGAVNIPFGELAGRLHELPPRGAPLFVAGPRHLASEMIAWLAAGGRPATPVPEDWPAAGQSAPGLTTPGRYRLWQPSPLVARVAAQLRPGRALDLACGCGRDAVYLASLGWRVIAIDRLPDAIERARDLERRYLEAGPRIDWRVAELGRDPLPGGAFDLVLAIRFVHRPTYRRLPAQVADGGSVLVEAFTPEDRGRAGRRCSGSSVLTEVELRETWPTLEWVECSAEWQDRRHVLRAWARRP